MRRLSLIIAMVLSLSFWYFILVGGLTYGAEGKPQVAEHEIVKEEIGKDFTCVMCGMEMKVAKSTPAVDYKGKTYYFCGVGEKKAFSKNPEKYATQESTDSLTTATGYTEHKIIDEELGKEATCPVTKKGFKITKNTPAIDFQGKTYYFCCPGCIGKFMASQTQSDSLQVQPDSLHRKQNTGGSHKHKGCC